jgi:hypothetical protein
MRTGLRRQPARTGNATCTATDHPAPARTNRAPHVAPVDQQPSRDTILEVQFGAQKLVARRSPQSPGSLDWEMTFLDHLARNGLRIPPVITALDGRRHPACARSSSFGGGTPTSRTGSSPGTGKVRDRLEGGAGSH